jgi:hypothetical protein
MMLMSENAFLPWTGAPVRKIDDLCRYFSRSLPAASSDQLPRSITLFADPDIESTAVTSFLQNTCEYLRYELECRLSRAHAFVSLGLLSASEVRAFMTARTDAQPWAIYYSRAGGLGISNEYVADPDSAEKGVIPCSSMRNHGVAWRRGSSEHLQVWLATSQKPHSDWDWDSDVGHESAHAAFAPVPLFLQALSHAIDDSPLAQVTGARELLPGHLARIMYFYSELAVVAIRGEQRPTPTGLPVADRNEIMALFQLSEELAPYAGFASSLRVLNRTNGFIDVKGEADIFELVSPIIKVITKLTHFTNMGLPPDVSTFRSALLNLA